MNPNYMYEGMKNLICNQCGKDFSIPIKDVLVVCPYCDMLGIVHEIDEGDILYDVKTMTSGTEITYMIFQGVFDYTAPGYMTGDYFDV